MPTRDEKQQDFDPKNVEIGRRITTLRERRGWNKSDLARKLQVKPSTVQRYETGELKPGGDAAEKLADIFGVSIDTILRGPLLPVDAADRPTPQKQVISENLSVAPVDFPEALKRYLEKHRDDITKRETDLLAEFGALHDPNEVRDEEFYDALVEAHREAVRRSRKRGGGNQTP